MDYKDFALKVIQNHLESVYLYDFIHEVLEVKEWEYYGEPSAIVFFRGTYGQYDKLVLRLPLSEFLEEIL